MDEREMTTQENAEERTGGTVPDAGEQEKDAEEGFEALIRGKYKEEFDARVAGGGRGGDRGAAAAGGAAAVRHGVRGAPCAAAAGAVHRQRRQPCGGERRTAQERQPVGPQRVEWR